MTNKKQTMILETSVIINSIFDSKINGYVRKKQTKYSLRGTYFILFEFKRGFIGNLIRYYLLIEKFGYSKAKRMLKLPQFSFRVTPAVLNLESFITDNNEIILNKNDEAMLQIESYISVFLDLFYEVLLNKELIGYPVKNDVLNFDLLSKKNYKDFIKLIDSRENKIHLKKFLTKNISIFEKISENEHGIKNKRFLKLLDSISKILKCVHENDSRLDTDAVFLLKDNQHMGDAIIATDMHKNHSLFTFDEIFKDICKTLNRKVLIIGIATQVKIDTLN